MLNHFPKANSHWVRSREWHVSPSQRPWSSVAACRQVCYVLPTRHNVRMCSKGKLRRYLDGVRAMYGFLVEMKLAFHDVHLSPCLFLFSVAVISTWPKATWANWIYFLLQLTVHHKKSCQELKVGMWNQELMPITYLAGFFIQPKATCPQDSIAHCRLGPCTSITHREYVLKTTLQTIYWWHFLDWWSSSGITLA